MAGTLAEDDLGGGEHLAALHDVPAHDVSLVIGEGHVEVRAVARHRARQGHDLEALVQAHSLVAFGLARAGQAEGDLPWRWNTRRIRRGVSRPVVEETGEGTGAERLRVGRFRARSRGCCLRGLRARCRTRTFDSEPTHVTMHPASSFAPLAYANRDFFRSCPGVSRNAWISMLARPRLPRGPRHARENPRPVVVPKSLLLSCARATSGADEADWESSSATRNRDSVTTAAKR